MSTSPTNLPYQPPSGALKVSVFLAACSLAVVVISLIREIYWAPAAGFFALSSAVMAVFFAKPARQRLAGASRRTARITMVASIGAIFSIAILDQDLGNIGGFICAAFCLVTTVMTGCISELTRNR